MPVVGEIPSIHFRDALQLIYERYGEDARHEPDLAPQHERWLCEWAMAEHGSPFLFVTHYPTVKRPFYTMPDPAEPAYTHGFDLLFRGLEVTTGGQRIHRPEQLLASMARFGVPPEPFGGYLEAFRSGMPPHGGFAIGLERLRHATDRRAQCPRDDALPARYPPADAVAPPGHAMLPATDEGA